MIVSGPGVKGGRQVEAFSYVTDLMPTLLGYLQVPAPEDMDGVDRRDWINDDARVDLPFAAESIAYGPELKAWFDGRLKLHTDDLGKPLGLFDVRSDRSELRNLVARVDSMVVAALRKQLLDWNDEALATAPPQAPPGELTDEMREGLKSLGYVE